MPFAPAVPFRYLLLRPRGGMRDRLSEAFAPELLEHAAAAHGGGASPPPRPLPYSTRAPEASTSGPQAAVSSRTWRAKRSGV